MSDIRVHFYKSSAALITYLSANLVAALASLNVHDFTHFCCGFFQRANRISNTRTGVRHPTESPATRCQPFYAEWEAAAQSVPSSLAGASACSLYSCASYKRAYRVVICRSRAKVVPPANLNADGVHRRRRWWFKGCVHRERNNCPIFVLDQKNVGSGLWVISVFIHYDDASSAGNILVCS